MSVKLSSVKLFMSHCLSLQEDIHMFIRKKIQFKDNQRCMMKIYVEFSKIIKEFKEMDEWQLDLESTEMFFRADMERLLTKLVDENFGEKIVMKHNVQLKEKFQAKKYITLKLMLAYENAVDKSIY